MPSMHKRKRKIRSKLKSTHKLKQKSPKKSNNNEKCEEKVINVMSISQSRWAVLMDAFRWLYKNIHAFKLKTLAAFFIHKDSDSTDINVLKSDLQKLKLTVEDLKTQISQLKDEMKELPKKKKNVELPASLPPPPPPIPPPPPPPVALTLKKRLSPNSAIKRKAPVGGFSLSDLTAVKLKKVDAIGSENKESRKSGKPVVTLKDIVSVKLRKSHRQCTMLKENLTPVVHKDQLNMTLRKTSMVRSPGGTPLTRRDNRSTATGLTPHMTRALLKKFKSVKLSPLHDRENTSPMR